MRILASRRAGALSWAAHRFGASVAWPFYVLPSSVSGGKHTYQVRHTVPFSAVITGQNDRQNVLAMMSGLLVSAIPGGQAMRTDLGNVLQISITADRDFIGWMQDPQSTQGCPASTAQDADYAAGLQASMQAMQAKKQFLALWNPLAQQFGQPTYTTLDI